MIRGIVCNAKLKKLTLLITIATLSGVLLTACSQSERAQSNLETKMIENGKTTVNASPLVNNSQPVAANQIIIENFAFKPAQLTVTVGAKVTWINKDDAPHTATDTEKRFNSGALDTNDQFSFVFREKGDYSYFCALHPQMKGRITVK